MHDNHDQHGGMQAPGLRLALFEPDMAANLGAALRLCACLGVALDVVGPCGFPLDDRRIRRSGLDYIGSADWVRHADFGSFDNWRRGERRRLVLLTTRGATEHHRHSFGHGDILMTGSESAGAPDWLHDIADSRVRVPMRTGPRSLNLVTAAAIVLGEALRQTGGFVQEDATIATGGMAAE